MKTLKFILACTLIILFADIVDLHAQKRKRRRLISRRYGRFTSAKQYWEIGFNVGSANYLGDLTPSTSRLSLDLGFSRPGFGISAARRLTSRVFIKAQAEYVLIAGSDPEEASPADAGSTGRFWRNLSFTNNIIQVGASGVIDFIENKGLFYKRPFFPVPYITLGFALIIHNPKTKAPLENDRVFTSPTGKTVRPGQVVSLRNITTEVGGTYGSTSFVLPIGAGVRMKLSNNVNISFEVRFNYGFTDYLDDVSKGTYIAQPETDAATNLAWRLSYRASEALDVNTGAPHNPSAVPGELSPNAIPSIIEKRGGAGSDHYIVSSIGLSYILSNGSRSPKFR